MTSVTDVQLQVLFKTYDTCQTLARSNAETAWKVRSWGMAIWSALVAYGFQSEAPEIIWAAMIVLVCVFFVELAVRQIEYSFIKRALDLEDSLTDALVGATVRLPEAGASTNIQTPSLANLRELFGVRRWLVWFPYLILLSFTLFAALVPS